MTIENSSLEYIEAYKIIGKADNEVRIWTERLEELRKDEARLKEYRNHLEELEAKFKKVMTQK